MRQVTSRCVAVALAAVSATPFARATEPPVTAVDAADGPPAGAVPVPSAAPVAGAAPGAKAAASGGVPSAGWIALLEGLALGYSALAAFHPEATGWSMVLLSPLACSGGGPEDAGLCQIGIAGQAGLGLYDALELRSDRYSRRDRFWRNAIGWNAFFAALVLADALRGRREEAGPGPAASLDVGVGPGGGPLLLLRGSF